MAFLDEAIRKAQAAVEQKFLFRKIGLPFDYASDPEEFPAKTFATAKEARANLPNPLGLGGGFAHSCTNHALLFDSYLLRIELGIESPGDEAILDRLIGGLIRLDTVAPKSFLVGGLAPDGRGFYAVPRIENHAAWSYAVHRGLATAAIAPESQEKFRSIAGKWMDRLKREKFRLTTVDGKPAPDGDLSAIDPLVGPLLLAMLLVAAKANGDEKDYELYAAAAEENSRARLGPPPAESGETMQKLMWRQAALSLIAANDPEPERTEMAKERMRDNAAAAAPRIAAWREWDASLADVAVDLDWRKFPKAPPEQSPLGFTPPESWARLDSENTLRDALCAMLTVLLAGDVTLAEPHAEEMAECVASTPWNTLIGLEALAPVVSVHGRGVEMGLWDKELYDSRREPPASEMSFSAKYLELDYDDDNPDKSGHAGPPPGKERPGQFGQGDAAHKRRRRRRRK